MRKLVKIYEDGKQFLVQGDLNIELNNHGRAEVYEVDIPDKEFAKVMEKPDSVKIDKIKNKRKIRIESRVRKSMLK